MIQVRLRAFTMAELLVIMIISGAVFLSVMEGVTMFRKYSLSMAQRIGHNSRFFTAYCRLDDMIINADSIRSTEEGDCELFYEDKIRYRLSKKDSMLVVYTESFKDTLLINVAGLSVTDKEEGLLTEGNVSVIVVTSAGEELRLSFRTENDMPNERVLKTIEKEEEWWYE